MPALTLKTTLSALQTATAQAVPAAKARRFNLGQNFVLDVTRLDTGYCLSVFSVVDGKDMPSPHVLSAWLGKDITGNRFYTSADRYFANISELRALTFYHGDSVKRAAPAPVARVA